VFKYFNLLLLGLLLFSQYNVCSPLTQLLGYAWVCKKVRGNDPHNNILLEGGFLDRDHGCRSCKICYYRYSQHPFWTMVWGNVPAYETLQCTCAVNGSVYNTASETQVSVLPLDSCPDSAIDTEYDCSAGCGVKRIENCNGALTCGDCSKQIKNP
jgi:hypothetical protein